MTSSARAVLAVMVVVAGFAWAAGVAAAEAQETDPENPGPNGAIKTSKLPVPRFVSLRSGEVNVRTGPGTRYPIEWVFLRKEMPVEVTAEFDTWRRIRDWQGSEGWVHQSMLSGKRAVVVTGDITTLRAEPGGSAQAVARAEPGVMGALVKCQSEWCEVKFDSYKGWLQRKQVWGVYANERVE
ncbi:MAG: SH3 domain-containing protein [Azospirillum sp.]|nr:SH3 domain-containing protein [Azospirillum sp.]